MRSRKPEAPEPLQPGRYRVYCRDNSSAAAALNGHGAVYPEAVVVSDGKWCTFYRDGKEVWSCNATYAAAHFRADTTVDEHEHD